MSARAQAAAGGSPPTQKGCERCEAPFARSLDGWRTIDGTILRPTCAAEVSRERALQEREAARSKTAKDKMVLEFPAKFVDGERWEAWITDKDLARHFKVAPTTIWRWRKRGMPSALMEGSRRFKLGKCEAWLRRNSDDRA